MKQNVESSDYHQWSNLLSADMSEVSVGYRFEYFIRCSFFMLNYSFCVFIFFKMIFNRTSYV